MFFYTRDRRSDEPARRIDGGEAGRPLGPAAQAGSESRTFRSRRARIKSHVLALRRTHRTNGPAIDAGRGDPNEELTVEAAVAGAHSAKTSVGLQNHGDRVANLRTQYSPFSDMIIFKSRRYGGTFAVGRTPKYLMIPSAASRPSNTAVTTRSDPRTMSPPANTLGLVV
jgi:hypothetical protein